MNLNREYAISNSSGKGKENSDGADGRKRASGNVCMWLEILFLLQSRVAVFRRTLCLFMFKWMYITGKTYYFTEIISSEPNF